MEKMVPLAIIVVFFFYLFADTEQLLARFNLGFLSYIHYAYSFEPDVMISYRYLKILVHVHT